MEIIGILLTILLGYSIIWIIKPKLSSLGKLSLAYLFGLGLQTLMMFYLTVARIKLTFINISIPIVLIILAIFLIGKYALKRKDYFADLRSLKNTNFNKFDTAEKLISIVILFLSIYVLIAGFYWPVVGWDSIALYDFRAKVFASTGFMDDAIARGYFFGYPLMTSMAHTWVYLSGGIYPKFLYSLMYISFGVLFYELLLLWTNKTTSAVFTILVLISPPIFGHAAFDYTNLPYTVYFFLGSVFLAIWVKEKKVSWLVLSALMVGLSTWIRSTDPFWIVNFVILVLILFIERKNILYLFLYSAVFFPIQQSWSWFLSANAPHVTTTALASQSINIVTHGIDFGRLLQIVVFVTEGILPILLPYIILALVTIFINYKNWRDKFYIYLLLIFNFGLLYLGAYIFSFIWAGWDLIGESLGRLSFVLIPFFLFLSAANLNLNFPNKKLFTE